MDSLTLDSLFPLVELTPDRVLRHTSRQHRRTKIVCAIGPATCSKEMLGKLLDAGMNTARFNLSHGSIEMLREWVGNLREAVRERMPWCTCAIMLDTKGPEIRTGFTEGHKPVVLEAGQELEIHVDYSLLGNKERITCNYSKLPQTVKPGTRILIADGSLILKVLECHNTFVKTEALNNFVLGERKNMNLPDTIIDLPTLTESDLKVLQEFAVPERVDFIAASFIRSAQDIYNVRSALGPAGRSIKVDAKIESVEGLSNLNEILLVADGVHVSRGDLGMELDLQKVHNAQRFIISMANQSGKPVVTATQMLNSMIYRPEPTCAECSDVANAVLNGTDAVMLSGETADGRYPIKAVEMMARICVAAEGIIDYNRRYLSMSVSMLKPLPISESVASAAVKTVLDVDAKLIVVLTNRGQSARMIAKYRPPCPIIAVTTTDQSQRQLAGLLSGVHAVLVESLIGRPAPLLWRGIQVGIDMNWVKPGDIVVCVHPLTRSDSMILYDIGHHQSRKPSATISRAMQVLVVPESNDEKIMCEDNMDTSHEKGVGSMYSSLSNPEDMLDESCRPVKLIHLPSVVASGGLLPRRRVGSTSSIRSYESAEEHLSQIHLLGTKIETDGRRLSEIDRMLDMFDHEFKESHRDTQDNT